MSTSLDISNSLSISLSCSSRAFIGRRCCQLDMIIGILPEVSPIRQRDWTVPCIENKYSRIWGGHITNSTKYKTLRSPRSIQTFLLPLCRAARLPRACPRAAEASYPNASLYFPSQILGVQGNGQLFPHVHAYNCNWHEYISI